MYTSLTHTDYESVGDYDVAADNENIILLYGKNEDIGQMQMHYAFDAPGCFLRHSEKYEGFIMTFVDERVAANLSREGFEIFGAPCGDEHETVLYKPEK